MAETYPASRFSGFDLYPDAVEVGNAEAKSRGSTSIRFQVKDVSKIDDTEGFNLITAFDSIYDQTNANGVLAGISRALKQDGLFLMQNVAASSHLHQSIDHPIGPFLYATSTLHCMSVSLAQGGAALGTVWGEEMLSEGGFKSVELRRLPHEIINTYYLGR